MTRPNMFNVASVQSNLAIKTEAQAVTAVEKNNSCPASTAGRTWKYFILTFEEMSLLWDKT